MQATFEALTRLRAPLAGEQGHLWCSAWCRRGPESSQTDPREPTEASRPTLRHWAVTRKSQRGILMTASGAGPSYVIAEQSETALRLLGTRRPWQEAGRVVPASGIM